MNLIGELGQETTYITSQTYHFSITETTEENSCRPFRRTLTVRWLQAASTEAAGNGSGAPQEEDADQTSPQLRWEIAKVKTQQSTAKDEEQVPVKQPEGGSKRLQRRRLGWQRLRGTIDKLLKPAMRQIYAARTIKGRHKSFNRRYVIRKDEAQRELTENSTTTGGQCGIESSTFRQGHLRRGSSSKPCL